MLLVGLWLNVLFELCCCPVVLEARLYTQLPFAAVYIVSTGPHRNPLLLPIAVQRYIQKMPHPTSTLSL
ncbi:hypothetical protein HYDPIDRAFT_120201, partial [Hydnomerulius pinastri MD-312]